MTGSWQAAPLFTRARSSDAGYFPSTSLTLQDLSEMRVLPEQSLSLGRSLDVASPSFGSAMPLPVALPGEIVIMFDMLPQCVKGKCHEHGPRLPHTGKCDRLSAAILDTLLESVTWLCDPADGIRRASGDTQIAHFARGWICGIKNLAYGLVPARGTMHDSPWSVSYCRKISRCFQSKFSS